MKNQYSDYLIIGAGLAGASAVEGIRALDADGSITMIGSESEIPYDRPPLTKKLWSGQKKVQDIYLHKQEFYQQNRVALLAGNEVTAINGFERFATDRAGERYGFGKLLLATGGRPRLLDIPGATLDGLSYFRTLDDYRRLREKAANSSSAVVLGGGFIGSEIAASLSINNLDVTMIYPSDYLCDRVFPRDLGLAVERVYADRKIRILNNQKPTAIQKSGSTFTVYTDAGEHVVSDLVVIGVGIRPAVELAEQAGLKVRDGIMVNEYLQTSHPDIYAAGDNARFPYRVLEQPMRLEHWDNALNQGIQAGRNMAGARESFTYMPYFFSDLFEFGYEAVGEIDSRMEIVSDWQNPYDTGVLYYIREGIIRGAMMCNVWDRVEEARDLIRRRAGSNERIPSTKRKTA